MFKKISGFIFIFLFVFPGFAMAYGDGLYINSYYAISSYADRNYANISDQVALGWGEVRSRNGNIYFTQKKYEEANPGVQYDYGVPAGENEVVSLVKEAKSRGARLKLSVFLNNRDILGKLMASQEIQNKVINEITSDFKIKYFDYSNKANGEYPINYVTDDNGNYVEYDGIIIDFEGLAPSYKDKFNAFINKLKQKLPKEKTLTICIPPKTGDADKKEKIQYNYGYDYAYLGKAADEIILMAHDFQYPNANPQYRILASAPCKLVEDAIKNARKDIPVNKILLAISINSIQWRKGETKPYTPGYAAVMNAIEGKNSNERVVQVTSQELRYDDTLKVGHALLKREIINNGTASVAEDDFYFENSRSIEDKIGLVKKYNLKGMSIWRLGAAASSDGSQNFAPEVFDPIFKYRMFDINKDGKINNLDLDAAMLSYGSKPGDPAWKKELDFDNNGTINIYDIARMTKYMSWN